MNGLFHHKIAGYCPSKMLICLGAHEVVPAQPCGDCNQGKNRYNLGLNDDQPF